MRITDFSISRLPRIEFGSGVLAKLPTIARMYGTHALLVTGAHSLKQSPLWTTVTCIVANSRGSSMKTNPIELSDAEIAAIIAARM